MIQTVTNKEQNPQFLQKRNVRILQFFRFFNIPVRIVGSSLHPLVIFENKSALSCCVNDYELILTTKKGYKGDTMETINLDSDYANIDEGTKEAIDEWFKTAEHMPCRGLKVTGQNLFFVSFDFINRREKKGKFVNFATDAYAVFIDDRRLIEIQKELRDEFQIETTFTSTL